MNKKNTNRKKLNLNKLSIVNLNENQMNDVQAGDGDNTIVVERNTALCPPPFNAPPYFYPNTQKECTIG